MKNNEITILEERYLTLIKTEKNFINVFEQTMSDRMEEISYNSGDVIDNLEIERRLNLISEKWGIKVSLTSSKQIYYWDYNNVQRFIN